MYQSVFDAVFFTVFEERERDILQYATRGQKNCVMRFKPFFIATFLFSLQMWLLLFLNLQRELGEEQCKPLSHQTQQQRHNARSHSPTRSMSRYRFFWSPKTSSTGDETRLLLHISSTFKAKVNIVNEMFAIRF